MSVTENIFGLLPGGETVHSYTIKNAAGSAAVVIDYGAVLVSLCVPDRSGQIKDVVLGYDDAASYTVNSCFFGAVIGPNGNRIADSRFVIDGKEYSLCANENENNLHSGPDGFEKKFWKADADPSGSAVRFTRTSPDGENGFPGNFDVSVTYELSEDNALSITYEGISDQATVANLTNHSYFNLNGEGSGQILGHELTIHADAFTPVADGKSIPTGEIRPVKGTVMDFCTPHSIGERIDTPDEQLVFTGGYDHNFVCNGYEKGRIREIAAVEAKESGIRMVVSSDCPCVQLYAGNFIKEETGKNGHVYGKRDGLCLETQVEPNAVNTKGFHSPVIRAGEKYLSRTIYRFETF